MNEKIKLFRRYQDLVLSIPEVDTAARELIAEVSRRLEHMQFALIEIELISKKMVEDIKNDTGETLSKFDKEYEKKIWEQWNQLEFFLEAFYYQTFRCAKCIEQLPGLGSFKGKYRGVTIIRNHLIEHSENSGMTAYSISTGGKEGPKYKNIRQAWHSQDHIDSGLYVNLSEFLVNFETVLNNAIEEIVKKS